MRTLDSYKETMTVMRTNPLVGVAVEPYNGIGASEFLRGLRILGMEFVEINRSLFAEDGRVTPYLKRFTCAFHLPLSAIDGWDFSNDGHSAEIAQTIEWINTRATLFNIRHAVVHPPEPLAGDASDSSAATLFRNLRRLRLPVYFENIPSMSREEWDEFLLQARTELGNQFAGICFDAPHFFVRGEDPIDCFERYRPLIAAIHLSDCRSGDDSHLSFHCGGELPVDEFLQAVAAANFRGCITLEITPPSFDDIEPYIESYLTVLRYLDYPLYLKKRMRLFALRPLIERFQSNNLQKNS